MSESILLIAYVLLGPIGWLMLLIGFVGARARLGRLSSKPVVLGDTAPRVALVIPARNEAANILKCIESAKAQDYPHYTIRLVDDRSTDATARILDEAARAAPGLLNVLHIQPDELPEDWLGKCNALHRATRELDAEWLCFVDSDVVLHPGALREVIAISAARNYDAVSLFPAVDGRTFWERLMIPLCAATWAVIFTASMTNDDGVPSVALANGQFFLIRREVYEAVGGHGAVRNQIVEDVELMRLIKSHGHRCRLLKGTHLVKIHMHATLAELRSGWGRIFAGTARFHPGRLIFAIIWTILCGLSVYPALAGGIYFGNPGWIAAAGIHWALIFIYLGMIYRATGMSRVYALLYFISGAVLVRLLAEGIHRCATRRFEWRGASVKV